MKKLSIIVPVYYNAESLLPLYNDLREKVLSIMNHSEEYEDILQKGRDTFSNQGNVCKDIMDAIDYYTQEGTEDGFMSRKLESEYRAFNMWN